MPHSTPLRAARPVRPRLASVGPDARTGGQDLADWLTMTGDWRPAFDYTASVRAVTAEQVLALTRDVLRPENRTVVTSAIAAATTGH